MSACGVLFRLGTVGPDNRTTGSYVAERGGDPYYFNIPAERPFRAAPGIMVHIPLGNDNTHQRLLARRNPWHAQHHANCGSGFCGTRT
jgi:hypothetical protein